VSDKEKGMVEHVRCESRRRTQVNRPMRCREPNKWCQNRGITCFSGISSEDICLLSERHSAYRRRELDLGFCTELGNQSFRC